MRIVFALTILLMGVYYSEAGAAQASHKQSSYQNKHSTKKRAVQPPKPQQSFFAALKQKMGIRSISNQSSKHVKSTHEPYSRYGNPDSYSIAGRKYAILKTAQGYHAKGIASWYGNEFHTKRTSSGDAYNMYAMTAAHKTLPLPSYVRVKNLDNGKSVIVRVNDRGPFRHDRLIDVSYAAANKLGLLPRGTARVEVDSVSASSIKAAKYYIQAAAYNQRQTAVQLRDKIKKQLKFPAYVEKYKSYYVVRIGPIAAKATIDLMKQKLARIGIKRAFSFLQ